MLRKPGLSLKDSGVGGSLDVIPMADSGLLGFEGRRDNM